MVIRRRMTWGSKWAGVWCGCKRSRRRSDAGERIRAISRGRERAYRRGAVDYFVVYLIPMDMWYILPFEKTRKTSVSLQFTPRKEGHKYEAYREAWHLLR